MKISFSHLSVLLATFLMASTLFVAVTSSAGVYDPWLDTNDDGIIDMKDIGNVVRGFGTSGDPIVKGSLLYDSGWLNLTDEVEQNYTLFHNLGLSTTTDVLIDARKCVRGWNQTYGGTGWDWAYSVVQTSDGGYALAGITDSFGAAGGVDFWLVKTDAAGNHLWNKTYGGTSGDSAYSVVQTSDGGYALAGSTWSFGAGDSDFWLVKTDSTGNTQWNQTYGGTGGDGDLWGPALIQKEDGGYALAGTTISFGAGGADFWLVKTDVESGLAWTDSTADTITLYRGATDPYWNYVRVRIWKTKTP